MAAGREIFGTDDFSMERAGDERVALVFAMLGVRDGHTVDFQSAADGALVSGLRLEKIGEGAQLGGLRADEVALRENDLVNGGSAELIFLLFSVEGLLLQLARFLG